MIKKAGIVLSILLYLTTVQGFAINLHYCGKRLESVKIDGPAKTCKDIAANKMKCCKDKQVVVKVKDSHQAESSSVFVGLFGFELPKIPFGDYILSTQHALLEKLTNPNPPPVPPDKANITIKNGALRI
jgi:hypothetical protein